MCLDRSWLIWGLWLQIWIQNLKKKIWKKIKNSCIFPWVKSILLGTLRMEDLVSSDDCCINCKQGGLRLIDPEEALNDPMSKWVIRATVNTTSSLQIFLQYRLLQIRLVGKGKWPMGSNWFLTYKFTARKASQAWNRGVSSALWSYVHNLPTGMRSWQPIFGGPPNIYMALLRLQESKPLHSWILGCNALETFGTWQLKPSSIGMMPRYHLVCSPKCCLYQKHTKPRAPT